MSAMTAKVLIAEDEANIALSLEFLMRNQGYEVRSATDGEAALREIESFRPDLILLDIMLPLCDGFEVCQRVRDDPACKEMKIVMLTAKGREVEVAKGLALGADLYLTKPFATRELIASVERLLAESR
ncbi:MAG TPA: response regulator [Burkholderiales bacterium]|nr:response regulator [Burkholderiales bacterium]